MRSSPLRHPARAAGASLLRLQSDERLIELATAGHDAAFDAIVVRYRTALTRYCAGIVGPDRADDAVQQTLINAHDALQRTDEVRHLRSWLYRIAHNVSLNVLRGVRDDVSLDDARGAGALVADGPAAEFERSEEFRATVAALAALPERQRAALVLRELEGRSHEEIAAALGVTKGSARQHLMRARVTMRGVVTAITPYPLIVRLADLAASSGGGAGWSDAVTGAGVGATLTKLTAGVVATGALVGGATVGTEKVAHGDHGSAAARAAEVRKPRAAIGAGQASAAPPATAEPIVARTAAPTTAASVTAGTRRRSSSPAKRRRHRSPSPRPKPAAVAPAATPVAEHGDDAPATSNRGRGRGGSENDNNHADRRGPDRGSSGSDDDASNRGKSTTKVERRRGKDDNNSGHGDAEGSGSGGKKSDDDISAAVTAPVGATPVPTTTTPTSGDGSGSSGGPGDSGSGDSGPGDSDSGPGPSGPGDDD